MNLKDLVSDLSRQTGVPAAQVRKVAKAFTQQLQVLIEQQEGSLRAGDIVIRPVTIPAKPASEGTAARPERKIARIAVRPRKHKSQSSHSSSQEADQA